MKTIIQRLCLGAITYILMSSAWSGTPLWTFAPLTATNISVTTNTTRTVQYILTNQSKKTHTLIMRPITGISQTTTVGNCAAQATLRFHESCLLTLQVRGNALPGSFFGGPVVCDHGNPLQCYQPAENNSLQVTLSAGTFFTIADVHLNGNSGSCTYGEDTGTILWESTKQTLANLISQQKPKFVIYLGDSPAHLETDRAQNIQKILQDLSALIQIPLFYVYGNNDSYNTSPDPTVDYGPFSVNGVNLFNLDPTQPWPALNVLNCPSSSACVYPADMTQAQTYGFYSAYPLGSATPLRLIVLNSVIFSYKYHVSLSQRQTDAQLEMDWFAAQLKDARAKNEKVYVAMHIPVGNSAFDNTHPDMWNTSIVLNGQQTPALAGLTLHNAFLKLMASYKNTIDAVMNGHTHMEEYRVLYSGGPNFFSPSVLEVGVPGITPLFGNNPGMQLYYYNNDFQLVDATTYFTTPEAITWLDFSFRNDYHCMLHTNMFNCLRLRLIPYLATGSASVSQYEINYPSRSSFFTPAPFTTWQTILNTIQIYPT